MALAHEVRGFTVSFGKWTFMWICVLYLSPVLKVYDELTICVCVCVCVCVSVMVQSAPFCLQIWHSYLLCAEFFHTTHLLTVPYYVFSPILSCYIIPLVSPCSHPVIFCPVSKSYLVSAHPKKLGAGQWQWNILKRRWPHTKLQWFYYITDILTTGCPIQPYICFWHLLIIHIGFQLMIFSISINLPYFDWLMNWFIYKMSRNRSNYLL